MSSNRGVLTLVKLVYNPLGAFTEYLAWISRRQGIVSLAIFFIGASSLFCLYPTTLLRQTELPETPKYIFELFLFVLLIALSNFLYVLLVDIFCDFKIKKKMMVNFLLAIVGISAVSSLLMACVSEIGILLLQDARAVFGGLVLLVWWWQWFTEAVAIKNIYAIHFAMAFVLAVGVRILSTVTAALTFFIVTGQIDRVWQSL